MDKSKRLSPPRERVQTQSVGSLVEESKSGYRGSRNTRGVGGVVQTYSIFELENSTASIRVYIRSSGDRAVFVAERSTNVKRTKSSDTLRCGTG